MKDVRIGCSGWVYASWREGIYEGVPQKRWLERYAEVFDTVEVNATFYRLIKRSTVEGWVERTPPGFLFAVKGSRYLTHIRRLQGIEEGVARFWEPLEPLRESGKLGPVLWQLPGSFHRDDAVLASTLEALPPARHCFEFRHESWFVPAVRQLLEEHGASLVIPHDARRRCRRRGRWGRSPTCGCTTAPAAATATTRRPSWTAGGAGSPPGARGARSSPTSTTTGRNSLPPTRSRCGGDSRDGSGPPRSAPAPSRADRGVLRP